MQPAGPVADPIACSGCGKLIDPLRAGHIAIFDLRFHFFCDRVVCRASFLGLTPGAEEPHPEPIAKPPLAPPRPVEHANGAPAPRPRLDAPIVVANAPLADAPTLPEPPRLADDRQLIEPIARPILTEGPPRPDVLEARDVGTLLLAIAIVAGVLAIVLGLAGAARIVLVARIVLAAVAAGMVVGRALTTPRDVADPHPLPVLAPSVGILVVATWAAFGHDPSLGSEAASLAGIITAATAVGTWMLEAGRRTVQLERLAIAAALNVPGRRIGDDAALDAGKSKVFDLRAAEHVLVEVGDVVPVDVRVVGEEVEVLPWVGATTRVVRRDGDAIVAGARVVRGRLRAVCTWAGNDRSFARVLLDPRRRADALAPLSHTSRVLVERWVLVASIVGGLSAVVAGRQPIEIAMVVLAVHAALATCIVASVASVHVGRGILLALRRGITYRSADAWDRAARVGVAMFCARGTLLLGEPELAELEAIGTKHTPTDVLALAAGAERTEEHPVATAIVRAAQVRGVRPDGVRNPNAYPGLGVTAVTSTGEELCVGNRALLLEQRISIAAAEDRIAELEALGRTVVLIAIGARLVGVLGLQDGLRPGARAAVQHLLDAQIEPVLISGDSRETCEAIGRSLDIDHIRPEVLPSDRGAEVRRLIDAGMSVAAIGHPGIDEPALTAADVSVALGAAGSAPGDYAVALASDDVRDAALSLALAHRTRLEARAGLAIAVLPALVGWVAVAFGFLPPAYAPVASLLGGAMAMLHVRALDRHLRS